jgi:excisionase family DNA binding protein
MSKLLNVAEVAERLNVSTRTVRKRIADGTLPAVKLGTESHAPVRIDEDELDAWVYGPPETKEN